MMDRWGAFLARRARAVLLAGIAVVLVRLGVAAQRQPAVTGAAGMIGAVAEATSDLAPGTIGTVKVRGELWRATASAPIPAGSRVVVKAMDGLTLTVERMDSPA